MKTIVTITRTNDQVKIKNQYSVKTKTRKPADMQTWKFKVLGELPEGIKAVRV
tara:strand:+ start:198 stop:356 length:159 start_codon:yes stop_codon:yes gene_type:complete